MSERLTAADVAELRQAYTKGGAVHFLLDEIAALQAQIVVHPDDLEQLKRDAASWRQIYPTLCATPKPVIISNEQFTQLRSYRDQVFYMLREVHRVKRGASEAYNFQRARARRLQSTVLHWRRYAKIARRERDNWISRFSAQTQVMLGLSQRLATAEADLEKYRRVAKEILDKYDPDKVTRDP